MHSGELSGPGQSSILFVKKYDRLIDEIKPLSKKDPIRDLKRSSTNYGIMKTKQLISEISDLPIEERAKAVDEILKPFIVQIRKLNKPG